MTGRVSSLSQQSSWPGENHRDPHYTLTVFPGGKTVLTTPSDVNDKEFGRIHEIFANWLASDDNYPLIIGNCIVQMTRVPPVEVIVERAKV